MNLCPLGVEAYDRAEAEGSRDLPYPALRAFSPAASASRVRRACELRRYVDLPNEVASRDFYLHEQSYSLDESEAIEEINTAVLELTRKLFGRRTHPFMSVLRSIEMFRAVEHLAARFGRDSLRVLEIGPGSGYLGALLIRRGHRYLATETTQALYLWQSRCFGHFAGAELEDFALRPFPAEPPRTRVTLLPWWHYAQLYQREPLPFDVVICDRALGDLDPLALRYVLKLSHGTLSRSDLGVFLFSHIGQQRMEDVLSLFSASGYTRALRAPLHGFAPAGSPALSKLGDLDGPPPRFTPSGRSETRRACQFLRLQPDEILESHRFLQFIGVPPTPLPF